MHKGVAARNSGHYSRQAYHGPGGFVSRLPLRSPTVEATVRSYARAWAQGKIRLADVPGWLRERVRDA